MGSMQEQKLNFSTPRTNHMTFLNLVNKYKKQGKSNLEATRLALIEARALKEEAAKKAHKEEKKRKQKEDAQRKKDKKSVAKEQSD